MENTYDIKMNPIEFGEYLLDNNFECEFEGAGDDFARYVKDNIEVHYYGRCLKVYETPRSTGKRRKIFWDPNARLDQLQFILKGLI